jgi:starvation-inducible outer membrane lipoprotein
MIKKSLLLMALTLLLSSCVVVKEYEKVNINDPDMALAQKKVDRYETTFQVYREAASGANGGKSGGGCGCN